MREEPDKREHSTKPEVDDLTDYQSLNSLGGAGVAGEVKATPAPTSPDQAATTPDGSKQATEIEPARDYNDGADFIIIDNKGQTNA
ncbi:MAG TPA: hypothetical protein VF747_09920 [Blastocatellia bacterium]|jgi:hypothetical protein